MCTCVTTGMWVSAEARKGPYGAGVTGNCESHSTSQPQVGAGS